MTVCTGEAFVDTCKWIQNVYLYATPPVTFVVRYYVRACCCEQIARVHGRGGGRPHLGRGADNSILEYTYLVVIILQKSRATQSPCTCAAKS